MDSDKAEVIKTDLYQDLLRLKSLEFYLKPLKATVQLLKNLQNC